MPDTTVRRPGLLNAARNPQRVRKPLIQGSCARKRGVRKPKRIILLGDTLIPRGRKLRVYLRMR